MTALETRYRNLWRVLLVGLAEVVATLAVAVLFGVRAASTQRAALSEA
jgi:hypothetical protein